MSMVQSFRRGLVAAALTAAGFAAPAFAQENLQFSSGSLGGSWYTISTGLANIVQDGNSDLMLRVVPGGGRDNPTLIEQGMSQLALGVDSFAKSAFDGTEPYTTPHKKLRSLGGEWAPNEFSVLVDVKETRTLAEILSDPKTRIGTSPRATTEEVTLRRALEFYGNSVDKINAGGGTALNNSYSQLLSSYDDNQIDVIFAAGSTPTGVALEVETGRRGAKILPFPEDLQAHLSEKFGYGRGTIPAGSYSETLQPGGEAISVTTMQTILLVSEDMNEETAYKITKTLIENRSKFGAIYQAMARFNPETAWKDQPVALHPGAERAYRELGYLK